MSLVDPKLPSAVNAVHHALNLPCLPQQLYSFGAALKELCAAYHVLVTAHGTLVKEDEHAPLFARGHEIWNLALAHGIEPLSLTVGVRPGLGCGSAPASAPAAEPVAVRPILCPALVQYAQTFLHERETAPTHMKLVVTAHELGGRPRTPEDGQLFAPYVMRPHLYIAAANKYNTLEHLTQSDSRKVWAHLQNLRVSLGSQPDSPVAQVVFDLPRDGEVDASWQPLAVIKQLAAQLAAHPGDNGLRWFDWATSGIWPASYLAWSTQYQLVRPAIVSPSATASSEGRRPAFE